ncbi:hypothetical protein Fleli_1309 [Bernardetia litoralis DSM 6794]|uniref:Outer membrane protein beta-barrel domain-containing protein n=1 Tax=Bernardetia litoralis (strain ATCC 23117 / DSM 6794 / NBRC 15988 / NCIMB 1366 / Fx l1 / Sio-4) TaxID=880071 RepID=I4AIF6_BERLS|nr:DUF6048 family protein [Bernardetia litoralis]AFM03741.1 hypothetical protein Fleli_1309 [Bernardetia litoralis DSM 6794]
MKKRYFNFLIQSILTILLFVSLFGINTILAQQNRPSDTTRVIVKKKKEPKPPAVYTPISFRVGLDMWSMLNNARNSNILRFNGNAEITLNNIWFVVLEGGYGDALSFKENPNAFQYQNTGSFGTIGIQYNVLHRLLDREALVIGAKYGIANFSHQLNYNIDDRYWDLEAVENDRTRFFRNIKEDNMSFSWAEINTGLKVNLARTGFLSHIYMSYLFKIRMRMSQPTDVIAKPTTIAGFGQNDKPVNLGFSYFLSYEF